MGTISLTIQGHRSILMIIGYIAQYPEYLLLQHSTPAIVNGPFQGMWVAFGRFPHEILTISDQRGDSITPVLKSLHWLPISFNVKYKVLVIPLKPYMVWVQATCGTAFSHTICPKHSGPLGRVYFSQPKLGRQVLPRGPSLLLLPDCGMACLKRCINWTVSWHLRMQERLIYSGRPIQCNFRIFLGCFSNVYCAFGQFYVFYIYCCSPP